MQEAAVCFLIMHAGGIHGRRRVQISRPILTAERADGTAPRRHGENEWVAAMARHGGPRRKRDEERERVVWSHYTHTQSRDTVFLQLWTLIGMAQTFMAL